MKRSLLIPTAEEKKKQRIKRKVVQSGIIPRNVRAKKGGAAMPEFQSGKSEKHVITSKGPEAVKDQNVEVPEVEQVQSVEKKVGNDDEVVITDERVSTPPPPPENSTIPVDAETSKPKKTTLPGPSEGFPNAQGEFLDDILRNEEFDMFHDATIKDLSKKVSLLEMEKEKAKAEAERDELKKKLEKTLKVNEELKEVVKDHAKRINTLFEDVDDNAKLFEQLSAKLSEVNVKYANMNETNQTLHQMLDELHEASANKIKVLKLEIRALRADKAVKDEQLNMLYTVEERRAQREKELAEAATQKKKELIVETQEAGGSSSKPEGDVEMVDAAVNVEVENMEVDQDPSFFLVGEAVSRPYNLKHIIRMVKVEEMEGNIRAVDIKLLCWKEEEEEKIVDEELERILEDVDNYDPSWDDFKDDEDDQGSTGMLIVTPSVQQSLDDFLNDEISEQEEDQHRESSSSGKQHTNQKEYEFKYANEADNFDHVEVEECSDISKEDIPFHYSGVDVTFPTLAEMFKEQNEDEIRRKVVEKITTEGIPKFVPQETLLEGRKNWFKVMPKERKFRRPLQYFTHNADLSLGDILSWGYLEDLKVYAIRCEQSVRHFEFLSDIQTLPWWDVEELHDQRLWNYIKWQAKNRFLGWKPQFPKQDIKIDLVRKEKDITLIIKPPRCLKNMSLCVMEQDFHEDFQGWMYNQSTVKAVISLFDKYKGESRRISVLDPMWLVNCSKKDIECLFYNKIVYGKQDKVQAQQYQKLREKRAERFKEISDIAAKLGRWKLMRPPPTNQTPIEKEENKIPRWDRKCDGDPVYRKYGNKVGRPLRRKMIAEREEKRRQKAKERRRSRKTA
ncbi:hypothetical protein Hanom_Chr12g01143881 [Helianthus anomalus]